METVLAIAIGVLTGSGVWLLLRPRTFQVMLGLTLISYAVNLFIFSMGRLKVDSEPVLVPGVAATLANTACVSTPTAQQSTANDCGTATVTLTPQLALTKTSSAGTNPIAGAGTVTYTLLARNAGVVAADGAVLEDAVPPGIDSFAWSCTSTGSAVAVFTPSSGTGAVNVAIGTFPPGAAVSCVVNAQTSASLPAEVKNSATLNSAIPGATCTPNDAAVPCVAEVSNPSMPVLSLVKSSNGGNALLAGGTVVYTVTAANNGTVPATGASVVDALPAGVASQTWSCTTAGGATCPNDSGTGALNEAIATWPAGGSLTYTITAQLAASNLPGQVVNNASVTAPAGTASCATPQHASATPPCTASATDTVLRPKVAITKTSTAGTLLAGSTFTYTVTVRSVGQAPAHGTVVADSLPANVSSWSWICTAGGGAACPAGAGTGALNETIATFPPGGQVVYAITAQLAASATGTVNNTATATPAAGSGGLCSPGDTTPPCVASVSNPVTPLVPGVSIAKTSTPGTLAAGSTFTYTVTATSNGNTPASGAKVVDSLPAGVESWSWVCMATGNAACPVANGTGPLNETIANFPVGGQVVYTITAKLAITANGTVANTVTVTPPGVGVCNGPCSASVSNPVAAHNPNPVPALSQYALALLMLMVAAGGAGSMRQRKRV